MLAPSSKNIAHGCRVRQTAGDEICVGRPKPNLWKRSVIAAVAFAATISASEIGARIEIASPVENISLHAAELTLPVSVVVRNAAGANTSKSVTNNRELQPVAVPMLGGSWFVDSFQSFIESRVYFFGDGFERLSPEVPIWSLEDFKDFRTGNGLHARRVHRDIVGRGTVENVVTDLPSKLHSCRDLGDVVLEGEELPAQGRSVTAESFLGGHDGSSVLKYEFEIPAASVSLITSLRRAVDRRHEGVKTGLDNSLGIELWQTHVGADERFDAVEVRPADVIGRPFIQERLAVVVEVPVIAPQPDLADELLEGVRLHRAWLHFLVGELRPFLIRGMLTRGASELTGVRGVKHETGWSSDFAHGEKPVLVLVHEKVNGFEELEIGDQVSGTGFTLPVGDVEKFTRPDSGIEFVEKSGVSIANTLQPPISGLSAWDGSDLRAKAHGTNRC